MPETRNNLETKVLEWLSKEGYPLEFLVANIFRNSKFNTRQGQYVSDFKTKIPREIDVVADRTCNVEKAFLRVSFLVECKYSRDKPWVVFSDRSSRISPAACIAQSISTKSVDAILWFLADDKELQKLSVFHTPESPGFNGRQAFGSNNDVVFSALQGIMSICYSEKNEYERYHTKPEDSLSLGVLLIPIIVVDGKLFEAFYNDKSGNVEIQERDKIRLHWRGSEAWHLHSTIDIVTVDALPEYSVKLSTETDFLLEKMCETYVKIKQCIVDKTLAPLESITRASRGVVSLPPLLRHLAQQNSSSMRG